MAIAIAVAVTIVTAIAMTIGVIMNAWFNKVLINDTIHIRNMNHQNVARHRNIAIQMMEAAHLV